MIFEEIIATDIHNLQDVQPEGWVNIKPIFEYYIQSSFCKPIKVVINNKLAGVGTAILLNKTGWLAHILVNPDFRKQGIGTAIVNHLLDYFKSVNCETVSLIATEMGYPIYKKVGFIDDSEYIFFEKSEPLKTTEKSKYIRPFITQDTQAIFSLDKKISGENRENILKDKIMNSYVYEEKNEIKGFFIPDLGEGLIIADTEQSGIELMRLRLTTSNKAVLPLDNLIGVDFLKENGFVETRRVKRMFLGEKLLFKPTGLFNRIAGNLG